MAELGEVGDTVRVWSQNTSCALSGIAGFVEWLADTESATRSRLVWLTPTSRDWGCVVRPLQRLGYEVRVGKRRGFYATLSARGEMLPSISGRSAMGFAEPMTEATPQERVRSCYEALQACATTVHSVWPSVSLGTSVAATGLAALKATLERDAALDNTIARSLRLRRAVGGGRIEYYPSGPVALEGTESEPVYEVDLRGAYPRAMQTAAIPAEYIGRAPESAWGESCVITTAVVRVPESMYPALRVEIDKHRVVYPTGLVLGTWTGAELRAAVATGAQIVDVALVDRFSERSEFEAFASQVVSLREKAGKDTPAGKFAKALAVQTVGALQARVGSHVLSCVPPERISGVRLDRAGVYSIARRRPSSREILSAGITVVGTVRAWIALVLHGCERIGTKAVYTHTDGLLTIGSPIRALLWAAEHGAPPLGAWKVREVHRVEAWAANQRITLYANGVEEIAGGGISRLLTRDEIRRQLRVARVQREDSAWQSSRRVDTGDGWTRAPRAEDVVSYTERLRRIYG